MRDKPIILRNGDIFLPIYDSAAKPNCCYVMISEDNGESWETYGPIIAPQDVHKATLSSSQMAAYICT